MKNENKKTAKIEHIEFVLDNGGIIEIRYLEHDEEMVIDAIRNAIGVGGEWIVSPLECHAVYKAWCIRSINMNRVIGTR